jgi:hypothetical protein
MADTRKKVAAGDLYTSGPNPGRLVVEYPSPLDEVLAATPTAATLLDRVLAATEAMRAAATVAATYENEPFTPRDDGTFAVKRGRPRKGRKTLRDYGLTKQLVYRARLLACIPSGDLEQ